MGTDGSAAGRGAAGGVPHVAGPGAGPVAGVGALLFQAGEVLPGRGRRAGSGERAGRGQGDRVHGGSLRDRNGWSAKAMVTSLRAFLRFAHATGRTAVPLAGAVPAVASWRLAALPRGLSAAEIERLLAGCDRETAAGLRDYAVLSLLARLGLRGAEAAGLQLGDIDWRAGEITVTGKGSRTERLPLPALAGEALAAWLTGGRPRCESRAVFVTVRRPYRQLTPEAVRAVMGRACDRAGLERRGAHRLRHALATEMLRAGASLPEVGQVLRHRSLLSTRSMPRSTRTRCARWRGRGREPGSERAAGQGRGVPGDAPGARVQADDPGAAPDELRRVLRGTLRRRVTADLAVEWATTTSRGSGNEVYQARRLDVVRIFARHLQALDPATEVPPEDVLARRYLRIQPYLYSPAEIAALMNAARTLRPALRAATWRTLIGLLAVTGMRQGEACRLAGTTPTWTPGRS